MTLAQKVIDTVREADEALIGQRADQVGIAGRDGDAYRVEVRCGDAVRYYLATPHVTVLAVDPRWRRLS